MAIKKSTRHSELVGGFGERIVCNWLSRSGFETCVADHTGLDIIAFKSGRPRHNCEIANEAHKKVRICQRERLFSLEGPHRGRSEVVSVPECFRESQSGS